ncbi:MAG: bifunctional diguanylate cyclase/phosphodiesterase [Gammaproteobacteria bacterium]|nr:MAG: bifunctional diguanylate cyclase/phosphodiesterase [Gammaproteobacteria bacterium]
MLPVIDKKITDHNPPSLRNRYIYLTLILGIIVIGIAFFSYRYVARTHEQVTISLDRITTQVKAVNKIRGTVLSIYQVIDNFLLDPKTEVHQSHIKQLIDEAISDTHIIRNSLLGEDIENKLAIDKLQNELEQLDSSIITLIDTRLDINRQYPALAYSANEMQPYQITVNNQFNILLNEINDGSFIPESSELFPLLLQANTIWVRMISQMRIYLANRFGSYDVSLLEAQANGVVFHADLQTRIITLIGLYHEEEESLEGVDAMTLAAENAHHWYDAFLVMRKINESDRWREDDHLMKVVISPLVDRIDVTLSDIGKNMQQEENRLINSLRNQGRVLLIVMTATTTLFLLFIGTILFSINRIVFKPIWEVTRAFQAMAYGYGGLQLPKTKFLETEFLIDAFKEMDIKVNNHRKALEDQSLHDALTGLPNRVMLDERLEYHIITCKSKETSLALFLVDLDRFKEVNDSLGHDVGDEIIILAGDRMRSCISDIETLGRLGGDEFAIISPNTTRDESIELANKLNTSFNDTFNIGEHKIHMSASIGIAIYPEDGVDKQILLQHADIAMYSAKRNRSRYAFYDPSEDKHSSKRIAVISDLRNAILQSKLELYFQPKLDIKTHTVIGAEALLRWNHPEFGYINPERIVDIAETEGFINELTIWTLIHAVQQCSSWHKQGYMISVAVNLSLSNLYHETFAQDVLEILQKYDLDSQYLTLEITENSMMAHPIRSIKILNRLHNMGIKLSVDDFGTGFSSLSYLKKLPVDELKIDKSFVMDMTKDDSDRVIVHSTIELGHNLGLSVVAEGIENDLTKSILEAIQCDYAQGYLFSKPLDSKAFILWLQDNMDQDDKNNGFVAKIA